MSATPVKKVPIHLQSSQNRLLIKNGKIVNCDGLSDGDIFIEDGIVKELGRNLIIPGGTRSIDARGKYVIPGGVDPNVKFDFDFFGSKSADDFYQGTKAAIAGGTTTVIDYVVPTPDQSLIDAYIKRRKVADDKVCCDYALHVTIVKADERTKEEMKEIVKEEYGINSFNFYMTYKNSYMLRDPELYTLFDTCRKIGAVGMVHAENGDVIAENESRLLAKGITGPEGHQLSRPEDVEAEAVTRSAMIANQVNCPLYVTHVLSKEAAEAVVLARSRGNVIFGETLAAGLSADGRVYKDANYEKAAAYVISPPLRSDPLTPETLLRFLQSKGLQVTASDHCTFKCVQKALGRGDFTQIPHGANGVEERLSIVWQRGVKTGAIDLPQFVELTSTNAAKIFNLYPRKGAIAPGSDADIVIWDPNHTRTISSKSHFSAADINIFEGREINGGPQYVIVNGRVCVDDFDVKAVQGHGKFLPAAPWSSFAYQQVREKEQRQGMATNGIPDLKPLSIKVPAAPESPNEKNGHSMPTLLEEPLLTPSQRISTPRCTTGRQMRLDGQRDLQTTTFSVGGDSPEAYVHKSSIRVANPPGGRSSGGFW